jgi:hypothetical protein
VATKIITKEFPVEILSMFDLMTDLPTYYYLDQEIVSDGISIYSMVFQEYGQNSKYAWKVYLEEKLIHENAEIAVYPVGMRMDGGYYTFELSSKATSVTGMLVTLKPVPTWLPVFDDEISTNTINELLTGST